jgi:DNA-binding HxlR family transcriptional regulator
VKVESDVAEKSALKEEVKPEESVKEKQVISGGKTTQILIEEETLSPSDFHNNDNKILAVLNEAGSNYSFKGLMRKLNLHQQSLSRSLHRLEEIGFVEKSPLGYKLSKTGESAIPRTDLHRPKGREYMQLLQTYIPLNVRAVQVVRQLVGRWFRNLRWLGMIESGTGYTLQWASDDGSFEINLRLIADYVIIETNASTEKEKVEAMVGSYAIYEQITKAMHSEIGAFADRQLFASSTSNN